MAAVGGDGQQPDIKSSGTWFRKVPKYCSVCGRGSAKVERETCQYCRASEWITAQDGAESFKWTVAHEATLMNSMEGTDNSNDEIMVCSLQEAITALRSMMETIATSERQRGERSFELRGVHFGKGAAVGKDIDDLLRAFLYWAQTPECREAERFNISKAMRRLESFAQFQEKYFDQYFSDPVLPSEAGFASVADTFNLMVWISCTRVYRHARTYQCIVFRSFWRTTHSLRASMLQVPKWTSKDGHVMWIMGFGAMQLSSEVCHVATMRYFWYYNLQSVFDYQCAIEGVVTIEILDGMSFLEMINFHCKFAKVEKAMQDLFYCCVPVKVKTIVLVGSHWWINMIVAITRMLTSKKMSERIVNTDKAGMHARFGGPESFPTGFCHGSREYVERYPGNLTRLQPSLSTTSRVSSGLFVEMDTAGEGFVSGQATGLAAGQNLIVPDAVRLCAEEGQVGAA
jgi:hypothetical protein